MNTLPTITTEQQEAIRQYLVGKHLPAGLGTEKEACSIAAINLALTGEFTDTIPACMSPVIGRWIICIQDRMPDKMRNGDEWRELLPLAAGTGRDSEQEKARRKQILIWMWEIALPLVQPVADKYGFGPEWAAMCEAKTSASAKTAAYAATDAAADAATADAYAAAAYAADAYVADAAATDAYAYAANAAAAWSKLNPIGLLRQLVALQ